MGLIDSLTQRLIDRAVKSGNMPMMQMTGARYASPDRRGFDQQAKAYLNQVVLACIATRAQTLNEPPLMAVNPQTKEILPSHPITRLFRRPNKDMSQSMFWQYVSTYADIGGNAYIHKVRNVYGQTIELRPYHSGHIVPVSESGQWVDYYKYEYEGIRKDIDPKDIIHIRSYYIDPLNPVLGISPIRAAGINIDTYNELMQTLYSYLKNNGVPSGVLTAQANVNREQAESLKEQFQSNTTGRNRGKPVILPSGMTYTQLGLNITNMEAGTQFAQYETAICGIYRVHPAVAMTMAGLQSSTYSNMQTAFQEFTLLTRMPTWNTWEEQVELSFGEEYPDIDVEFDTSNVAALQSDPDAVIYPVVAQFNANLITVDEARAKMGFKPAEANGNQYAYERAGLMPMAGIGLASAKIEGASATVIVDIDDTLINAEGNGIAKNVAYVNELHKDHRIEIVTGRPDTQLHSTKNDLERAGVHYDGLHLNDTPAPSIRWKEYKAKKLMETQNVTMAIDNDADVRAMYESLGINAKAPSDIPAIAAKSADRWPDSGQIDQSADVKAEAYWRTMDELVREYSEKLRPDTEKLITDVGNVLIKETAQPTKSINSKLSLLTQKYMKATGTWRKYYAEEVMKTAIRDLGVDFTQVKGSLDKIIDETTAKMALKIEDSVGKIYEEVIAEVNAMAGASADEIQKALTSKFETLPEWRAKVIARTTARATGSEVSDSTWEAMNKESKDEENKVVKVWTTRRDGKVRSAHRELDGKWVITGQQFSDDISAPGIASSPELAANCRCVLRPVRRKNL